MTGYDRVKIEILRQAVSDYKTALRSKNGYIVINVSNYRTVLTTAGLEKWFLSSWGQMLSGANGEYIIRKCKEDVKKEQKKHNVTG